MKTNILSERLIEGLTSGLFCMHVCGDARYRKEIYKTTYKEFVDKGLFIHSIEPAPRDARYKIDWYFKEGVNHDNDTLDYDSINFFTTQLKFLGIDTSFNPTEQLRNNPLVDYSCNNDITIGYGKVKGSGKGGFYPKKHLEGYYFKYKGEINTLDFKSSGNIVDYNEDFWARYKDVPKVYRKFDLLMHNIGYFITYKGLVP